MLVKLTIATPAAILPIQIVPYLQIGEAAEGFHDQVGPAGRAAQSEGEMVVQGMAGEES